MRSLENFSKSVLGSWMTQSVIENVVEGVGWAAGQIGGSYIGSSIGQVVFEQATPLVSIPLALMSGYQVGKISQDNNASSGKSLAVGVTTTIAMSYAIPPLVAPVLSAVGSVVGGYVGALSLGTTCAYACIKLVGSNEKLFDFANKANNYTTKTAISVITTNALGIDSSGFCYLDAFIANQIIGSISFHSVEALELSKMLREGTALDNYFPRRIGKLLASNDGIIKELISDVAMADVHQYMEFALSDTEVPQLLNRFKSVSTSLCAATDPSKTEELKVELSEVSANITDIIYYNICTTREYAKLYNIFESATAEQLNYYCSLIPILGNNATITIDDEGNWNIQLSNSLIRNLSLMVHNKFKALEMHLVGYEFSGAIELHMVEEFVRAHANNFCMFALGNTPHIIVNSAYTDAAKVEEYNKELYKTLNHLILGYYQTTIPSIFAHGAVDRVIEEVDHQIETARSCL